MDIELPDGTILKDIPEGTTKAQLTNKLVANGIGASLNSAEDRAMADPTKGMSGSKKFLAGAGKAFADIGRGAQQLVGVDNQQSVADSRKQDAPLMKTGAGVAGNLVGNVAAVAPTFFIPGVNTYTGAALVGTASGALQPVLDGESRALNAGVGLGTGMLGQGVGNAISRAIRPVASKVTPELQTIIEGAKARNIPISAGQATGSRPLQVAESVMENLPLTSGKQLAFKQGQQEAFNKAVGNTFGSSEAALTPAVMGEARNRIGGQFSSLAAKNTLRADDQLINELAQIETNANKYLTPDVGRVVTNRMNDVLERIENGAMPGKAYRNLDSEIGKAARSAANGDLRNALGELRGTLRSAMDRSISETDSQAWKQARQQYANLMTVAPLAAKSEVGNVSGRTLLNAANNGMRNAKFGGQSELAELGRIGRAVVSDKIPNSGTAQRQLMQSLLTGGSGAGLGAGAAYASGKNPLEGAALGVGLGAGGLLAPRLAQAIMQSQLGNAYLTRGITQLTPLQLRLINAATRGTALGLAQ